MMDSDLIQYLTDEQKANRAKMEDFFRHPGWALMRKWAKMNSEEAVQMGASALSWEENRILLGKRMVFDIVANLEQIQDAEYSELARERRAEAQQAARAKTRGSAPILDEEDIDDLDDDVEAIVETELGINLGE